MGSATSCGSIIALTSSTPLTVLSRELISHKVLWCFDCIPRRVRPVRWWLASFALLPLLVAGSALAQSRSPLMLTDVFQNDLPEVTPTGLRELKEALGEARLAANGGKDCYPPSLSIMIMSGSGDPWFADALGKLREAEMKNALQSLGVSSSDIKDGVVVVGHDASGKTNDVRVTYGATDADNGSEPPVLVVHSKPEKGSTVDANQEIPIRIKATELPVDGYSGWPIGIQLIRLKDDNGTVNNQEFDKPLTVCAPQIENWTYTTPKIEDLPAVVHLTVEAVDGGGHLASKSADFPTGEIWKGTWSVDSDNTDAGTRTVTCPGGTHWNVDVALAVRAKGVVKGYAKATRTGKACNPRCPEVSFENFRVSGDANEDRLSLLFVGSGSGPAGSADCSRFGPLFTGFPKQRTDIIPIVRRNHAEARFEPTEMWGAVIGQIRAVLECENCKAAPP